MQAFSLASQTVHGWTPSWPCAGFWHVTGLRTLFCWGPLTIRTLWPIEEMEGGPFSLFFPLQSLSRSPFHVCFWANNVLSQHNRPLILLYNKQAFRSGHMQELLIKMQQATPPPSSHTRANITTRVHTLTHTNENILYSDLTLPHEQTKQCSLEEWAHDHNSPLHWHYCDHLHIFTFLQTTFEMQQRNICFSLHVSLSRGRCALLFPIYLLLSPSLDTQGRSSAEYTAQWPIIPHIKPQAWTNTISNASLFRSSIPQ